MGGALASDVDPATPVLVGVGRVSERVGEAGYARRSAVALAATAARLALADAGVPASAVDTIAGVRQLETSAPGRRAPLGRADNTPRAIAAEIGADPARAVLDVAGGQSPQRLVNEFAAEIAAGRARVVLIVGGDAVATTRALADAPDRPDFHRTVGGQLDDRGYGLGGQVTRYATQHGLRGVAAQCAVLENARRARTGLTAAAYRTAMGRFLARQHEVAAADPHGAAGAPLDAADLVTPSEARNPLVATPYPRALTAPEDGNQGAAVLLCSLAAALELGVPTRRWVFLHGHADLADRPLLDREDLATAPAATLAVTHALEIAGIDLARVRTIDIDGPFPVAVLAVLDGLDLTPDDPRGLTLTGGAFFGGGNHRALHAIAATVARLRAAPGTFGLVTAGGSVLKTHSVGVYSTAPTDWRPDASARLQATLGAAPPVATALLADGPATIESWTVTRDGAGVPTGIVVGRLDRDGRRFLATTVDGDDDLIALLEGADPVGTRVHATSTDLGNRVTRSSVDAARLLPATMATLRERYEHILVRRDGHVLEVTINRPERRNALHPPASHELTSIFDAYTAADDLWVAILTGAGEEAFSAGADLRFRPGPGQPTASPTTGFAGLTSRPAMTKPVIAAVNGFALGGGTEIVLACHLVVADETASFGLTETRVGLVPGAGGLVRLPRVLPMAIATEMVLTGRRMGAREAHERGLVNRVVPAGTALAGARELAAEILASSPTAVRTCLEIINETRGIADTAEAVLHRPAALDDLWVTADLVEGTRAFVEKRAPRWRNR